MLAPRGRAVALARRMKGERVLSPCPFCGSVDVTTNGFDASPEPTIFCVYCDNCEASGPEHPTPGMAILSWNKRTTAQQRKGGD